MKRGVLTCQWCGHPASEQLGPVWIYDEDDQRREPMPGEGVHWRGEGDLHLHERCWSTSAHLYDMPRRPGFGGPAEQLALEMEAA